jgi:TonB family protein
MTFDPTTKKAALFSGLLHLFGLLFLILAVIFSSLFAKEEEPHIFEMVSLPESMEIVEAATMEPSPEIMVDIPELEPIEIPQPELEPVKEPPPPPKPEPVIQKPVERTPPPVPVEKPPEPKKEEPKPKIISFDDYKREHGAPKAPPPEAFKPQPVKRRPIDTSRIEDKLRKTIMGVPELTLTSTSSVVDTDAMKAWRSLLAAHLDALWKQIETKGTAGKSVLISFYISSGGSISSIKIVRASGLSQLDNLGIQTVRNLGSLQPPPSGKGETVTVLFKVE